MPMCDAIEMMEYCAEYPPAHVILKQVYASDKTPSRRRRGSPELNMDAGEHMQTLGEVHLETGMPNAGPVPKHLAEMAEWADETMKKAHVK